MAVFKLNICKFNNCDQIFSNLENLIRHIETNHINYDPKVIEQFETQQPTCLPLSYVLKFFTDMPVEEKSDSNSGTSMLKQSVLAPKTGLKNNDDDDDDDDDDNNYNSPNNDRESFSENEIKSDSDEKSQNWMAVKSNNSRISKNQKVKKSFKCHCGKTYGSSPNLRKHAIQCHNATIITAEVKEILQNGIESKTNGLIQPYQSISLKQITSNGSGLKTLVVSTKPSSKTENSQPSQLVHQPQRVMIKLTDLNSFATV